MRSAVAGVLLLLVLPWPSAAAVVGGAQMPARLHTPAGELHLVSCGVRDSLWIEHYATALYVPRRKTLEAAAAPEDAKVVRIRILDPTFLPDDLPEKWARALRRALPEPSLSRVQRAYDRLAAGDRIQIAYFPESGVSMRVNGRVVAKSRGHAVIDSILEAWAEGEPVTRKLRELASRHPC